MGTSVRVAGKAWEESPSSQRSHPPLTQTTNSCTLITLLTFVSTHSLGTYKISGSEASLCIFAVEKLRPRGFRMVGNEGCHEVQHQRLGDESGGGERHGGSWLPGLQLASLLSDPHSCCPLGPGKGSVHGEERERGLRLPRTLGRVWGGRESLLSPKRAWAGTGKKGGRRLKWGRGNCRREGKAVDRN